MLTHKATKYHESVREYTEIHFPYKPLFRVSFKLPNPCKQEQGESMYESPSEEWLRVITMNNTGHLSKPAHLSPTLALPLMPRGWPHFLFNWNFYWDCCGGTWSCNKKIMQRLPCLVCSMPPQWYPALLSHPLTPFLVVSVCLLPRTLQPQAPTLASDLLLTKKCERRSGQAVSTWRIKC